MAQFSRLRLFVYGIVAFLAKSNAVGNVKSKFREFGEMFDVVCVENYASLVAFLASVIISCENRFTPYFVFFAFSKPKNFGVNPISPVGGFFTCSRFGKTPLGTKQAFFKTIFMTIIRLTAERAYFIFTFPKVHIVMCLFHPYTFTRMRTVFPFINQVGIDIKRFFANRTNFNYASSFSHYYNYNSIEGINQLWLNSFS